MINISDVNENYCFPKFNSQIIDISDHLAVSRNKIHHVQTTSTNTGECYLSFYPLAKNIRFVSTHFFESILNNNKPRLSNGCRPGEDSFWKSETGDSWFPWLWTRYFNKKETNLDSWSNIFEDIEDVVDQIPIDKDIHVSNFFLYLSCLGHTYRLNKDFSDYLFGRYLTDFPNEPICGLQIRRGEIVPKDGNLDKSWGLRPTYSIDNYMEGASKICSILNTKNIFISTDSMETVEYLENNYKDYRFFHNKYDRNLFIRYDGDPNVHLEVDLQSKPHLIQHYTESCLVDLYSLSKCHGYVGGMKHSEYGICGWFLQMIKQSAITPYFNVEGEFDLRDKNVGMLLR